MKGYSLREKKMVEFQPTKTKKLKNGLTIYMGKDSKGNMISTIRK